MEPDIESWKPINDYNGYEVSSHGRIKSLTKEIIQYNKTTSYKRIFPGRILKQCPQDGYWQVTIYQTGHRGKKFRVHRLVAQEFIPNPENKPEVNHIDGDRGNSHYLNLEWVTSSENKEHAFKIGLSFIPKGKQNHFCKYGIEITDENKSVIAITYGRSALIDIGLNPRRVYDVLNGLQDTHRGYTFKKVEK